MDFCRLTFASTAVIEGRDQMAGNKAAQIAVLHIPHSSRHVPALERRAISLGDAALNNELLRMTDSYTDELFSSTPVESARLVLPVSRLVCDVERFSSDADEPMAARGMGVIYTQTSMGDVLKAAPNAADCQMLMDRWYWPHHSTLERLVSDVAGAGICLIVHSFASVALPYELDQTSERADICVGTDPFPTPPSVRDAIIAAAGEGAIRSLLTLRSPVRWCHFRLTERIAVSCQ
jgi:N-formylglutamate deformylase